MNEIAPLIADYNNLMDINPADETTLECWFNAGQIKSGNAIFSKGISGYLSDQSDYILQLENTITGDLPEVIGSFINSSTVNSSSRTLNVPTHAEGDLLIAIIMWRDNLGEIKSPEGWKFHGNYLNKMSGADTFDSQRLYVYTKIASNSEPGNYTWTAPRSDRAHAGAMVAVRNGSIKNVRESYGNGSTSTISTLGGVLNITSFTWIYSFSASPASYSQSIAGGASITQISDSPIENSRMSAAYSTDGGTVTSTIQATTTTYNPNHCGICIEIVPSASLNFYALSENSQHPILKSQNIIAEEEWYHCAIVKDELSSRMYINGIESATSPINDWHSLNTGKLHIGSNFSYFIDENNFDTSKILLGQIDNFKFTKKSKYKNNFNIAQPINEKNAENDIKIDKFFDKTILSLYGKTFHNDYAVSDSSIYNWDITNINNVKITAESSPFSYRSINFNGTNNVLTLPNNEVFDIVNDDFSIECWIYPKNINTDYENIISYPHSGGVSAGGWRFGISIVEQGRLFFSYGDGGNEQFLRSNEALKIEEWQHISVSRSENTLNFYINGGLKNSSQLNNSAIPGNRDISIGGSVSTDGSVSQNLDAIIDGLKITKGISKYKNEFSIPNLGFIHNQKSDPQFSNVSLLMYGNNQNGSLFFNDESRYNVSRLGNGCAYFRGAAATTFLSVVENSVGNFDTGNFTIELWAKPMQFPDANDVFGVLNKTTNFNSNNAWRLYISGSSGIPTFEYTLNGTSNNKYIQGPPINNYEWNNICVVRNSGLITLYSNGISGSSDFIGNDAIYSNNLSLQIGRYQQVSDFKPYNGFIEDLRITKNIARYVANFSGNLPEKYGSDLNEDPYYNEVDLFLKMNGYHNLFYITDSSKNKYVLFNSGTYVKLNNDVTANGTSITNSSLQSVFGGASIRGAGGSTSSLQVPSVYDFGNFGTGDFTVEWWNYFSGWNNGYFPILHYGNDGDYDAAKSRFGIYYSSSGENLTVSISGDNIVNFPVLLTGGLALNSGWIHNALTRKNGYINLFIDGIKHPSEFLMDYNISRGVNISTIGAGKYGASLGTLHTMNGYLDDLRVTKGIARYIENFTPPSEQYANF